MRLVAPADRASPRAEATGQFPIRIVIADDHAIFRQGLKLLLKGYPDVRVVAEAGRLEGLDLLLATTPCDVLLLDLRMERSALAEIESFAARTRVLVVTASENLEDALEAMRAGARGVVFKRYGFATLMDAIRQVSAGQVWMPPLLQSRVTATLRHGPQDRLTPREREILRHVALGLRNADIARRLFIDEKTVKTHLNNIFPKIGVRDRVELALYAVRIGLVAVHEWPSHRRR